MSPGDFRKHAITQRYGFIFKVLDGHLIVHVPSSTKRDVVWSEERALEPDRPFTDKEWASYVAYQLTGGDN